jgi:hypothetical protein
VDQIIDVENSILVDDTGPQRGYRQEGPGPSGKHSCGSDPLQGPVDQ